MMKQDKFIWRLFIMYGNIGFGGFPCPPQPCPPIYCPPQAFPAQYDPPLFDPPQQYVKTNLLPKVVPHVHPSHTTTVNKLMVNHQHYFPHTESCVNECCETHTMCGVPVNPCCPTPFGF